MSYRSGQQQDWTQSFASQVSAEGLQAWPAADLKDAAAGNQKIGRNGIRLLDKNIARVASKHAKCRVLQTICRAFELRTSCLRLLLLLTSNMAKKNPAALPQKIASRCR